MEDSLLQRAPGRARPPLATEMQKKWLENSTHRLAATEAFFLIVSRRILSPESRDPDEAKITYAAQGVCVCVSCG